MRVVLMGRTMAGKSTMLAALTGGSADRIGIGAQRTSRDVFAAPALGLDAVEIVDTPGVGAKDGADDVALALGQVPSADLVVWVASNDSFQEETAKSLRSVALHGKPVVVVLNCRAALVDDLAIEDFLSAPERVFEQHEGHFSVIRGHLADAGIRPVAEVMLHAEAARMARQAMPLASDLLRASRVGSLTDVLYRESHDRRATRRVLREADEVRAQALALGEIVADIASRIEAGVQLRRDVRHDQEGRAGRLIDACEQQAKDAALELIGKRRSWPQSVVDFGPQVDAQWEKEQTKLVRELDASFSECLADTRRKVDAADVAAEYEWKNADPPPRKVKGEDFRGVWRGRVAALIAGVGVIAASGVAGGLVGGPVGAGIGLVAGPLGTFVAKPVRRKVKSLFKSRAQVLQGNRRLLTSEVSRVLGEMQTQRIRAIEAHMDGVRTAMKKTSTLRVMKERVADLAADSMRDCGQLARVAVSDLDRATIRCLLHLDGRPRLADSIQDATRLAGVCSAVQTSPSGLAEAWLFPPSSPEALTFGREEPSRRSGAHASSYALGLTGEVPTGITQDHDGTSVHVRAPVPQTILSAWSAVLSDHLGVQVNMVNTGEGAPL